MVYLDYNATTPLRDEVLEAYNEAASSFGNPASIQHGTGTKAQQLLENSREKIADLLGVSRTEIIFTSGATESALISVLGIAANKNNKNALVTAKTEHNAVLEACTFAARLTEREVWHAQLNPNGSVNLDVTKDLLEKRPALLCLMAINNETGVVNPIKSIYEIARTFNVPFISDLTQAAGKRSLRPFVENLDIGFMSAHKFYGPKGIGIMIAKRGIQSQMVEVLAGGGQERNLRGGTQNVPAIYATAVALEKAELELSNALRHYADLRSLFIAKLRGGQENPVVFAEGADVVENTVCVSYPGVDGDMLIANLQELEFSTGSACNSAVPEPSHVFSNCDDSRQNASEWVRFSFGMPTTANEVEFAADKILRTLARLRGLGVTPNAV